MSGGAVVADAALRHCVRALWALIEAAGEGDRGQREQAAAVALEALTRARGGDGCLALHERDGVLHVGGRRLLLGVEVFQSVHGLVGMMRRRDVGEVLFDADVDAASLLAWAEVWAQGPELAAAPPPTCRGIRVDTRTGGRSGAVTGGDGGDGRGDATSQLRSTFLQHQLISSFTVDSVMPPHVARVALAAVFDRMLGLRGGMEPLTVLERDPELMHRSLHVAAYAVVFGRALGWPEDRLADLGGAALLHDIGAALDPRRPEVAGFAWLLGLGTDPFWLRGAVVARTWRRDRDDPGADPGEALCLAPLVVRLAAHVEREVAAGRCAAELAAALPAVAARGGFPPALVRVAVAALDALRALW